jgi:hypothetical protein
MQSLRLKEKLLVSYAGLLTVALVLVIGMGAAAPNKTQSFDEITVRRINVVEADGTLRMVISDHANFPGVIVKGKEGKRDRPYAGMIFYNDEGSENGGLIFGGRKNPDGKIVDSGGSLTFDKYGANQIVQIAGVSDSTDRFAGVRVWDSSQNGRGNPRVWVGHADDGAASVALMDEQGRKRIVMQVDADGSARLNFLGADGKIARQLLPEREKE